MLILLGCGVQVLLSFAVAASLGRTKPREWNTAVERPLPPIELRTPAAVAGSIVVFCLLGLLASVAAEKIDYHVGRFVYRHESSSPLPPSRTLRAMDSSLVPLAEEALKMIALCLGLFVVRRRSHFSFEVILLCGTFAFHELWGNLRVFHVNLHWPEAIVLGFSRASLHEAFTLLASLWLFAPVSCTALNRRIGLGILGSVSAVMLHSGYNTLVNRFDSWFYAFTGGALCIVFVGLRVGTRAYLNRTRK